MKFVNVKTKILGNKPDTTTAARYHHVINHKSVIRSYHKIITERQLWHTIFIFRRKKRTTMAMFLRQNWPVISLKGSYNTLHVLPINKTENCIIF